MHKAERVMRLWAQSAVVEEEDQTVALPPDWEQSASCVCRACGHTLDKAEVVGMAFAKRAPGFPL